MRANLTEKTLGACYDTQYQGLKLTLFLVSFSFSSYRLPTSPHPLDESVVSGNRPISPPVQHMPDICFIEDCISALTPRGLSPNFLHPSRPRAFQRRPRDRAETKRFYSENKCATSPSPSGHWCVILVDTTRTRLQCHPPCCSNLKSKYGSQEC